MSFEELEVFRLAIDLSVLTYDVTRPFPKEETYGLTTQMRRASTSIISNITEGEGRLTRGEQRQFLSQARGSLYELEAQCIIANKLEFLNGDAHARMRRQIKRTCVALNHYIDFVRSNS